jgi:hypothetical protein
MFFIIDTEYVLCEVETASLQNVKKPVVMKLSELVNSPYEIYIVF